MKHFLIALIKLYQRTLSPDHSWLKSRYPYGYCRFYPSCSAYAVEALQSRGTITGTYLTIKRIIKCNPFSSPGVDSLPKK